MNETTRLLRELALRQVTVSFSFKPGIPYLQLEMEQPAPGGKKCQTQCVLLRAMGESQEDLIALTLQAALEYFPRL